jgi:polysaccharide transporter, PST family
MPGLSRIEHDETRYRRAFCGILENLAMAVVPGALFASVTADWIVRILLGRQWQAATPLVACFAVAAAYQPLIQAAGLLYLTQNRPREMVRAAFIDTTLGVLAVLASLPFGTRVLAASLAITGLTLRAPAAFWLCSRRGPVGFADIALAILPSSVAGIASAGTVILLRQTVLGGDLAAGKALALAALAALPAALATLCAIPRSRRALGSLRAMARHLRNPAPRLAQ